VFSLSSFSLTRLPPCHSKALPTRLRPRVLCVHPSAPITPSPVVQCALSRLGKDRLHGHLLLEEPRSSPGLESQRARAPATPARSRTFSPARRSPPQCAAPHNLESAQPVLSKCFHRSSPPWQARRRVAASNALACRQLPHCRYRKKWVCTEFASLLSRTTDVPALEQRFLDCGCRPEGTAASPKPVAAR
jgi:hypothetical protein